MNGAPHLKANYPRVSSEIIPVKKGDVISIELTNRKGDTELVLVAFRDNQPVLDISKFKYVSAADPDWKTNPDLTGYKVPLLKPRKNFAMGNVKEPPTAQPLKEDAKFKKHFFKYVVP